MGTVAGRLVGYCRRMGTVAGGLVGYCRMMGTIAGRIQSMGSQRAGHD